MFEWQLFLLVPSNLDHNISVFICCVYDTWFQRNIILPRFSAALVTYKHNKESGGYFILKRYCWSYLGGDQNWDKTQL